MKKNYVGLLLAVAISFSQFGTGTVTVRATTDNGAATEAADENTDTSTGSDSASSNEGAADNNDTTGDENSQGAQTEDGETSDNSSSGESSSDDSADTANSAEQSDASGEADTSENTDEKSDESTDADAETGSSDEESADNAENSDSTGNTDAATEGAEDTGLEDPAATADATGSEDETKTESDDFVSTKDFKYETEVDGYTIRMSAKKGVFPDDVSVKVRHYSEDEEEEIADTLKEECDEYFYGSSSFEITFFDAEEKEIQPKDGEVQVSIDLSDEMIMEAEDYAVSDITIIHTGDASSDEVKAETEENGEGLLSEGGDCDVYHSEDGEPIQVLNASPIDDEDEHKMSVSFSAKSFSTYSLVLQATYTFTPQEQNGEKVIYLNDTDALKNHFFNYVQDGFSQAAKEATATKKCRVVLPTGTYNLGNNDSGEAQKLRLGSNTTFDLNGSTVINCRNKGMIIGAKGASKDKSGYGGFSNMAIVNGALDANTYNLSGDGFVTVKFAHVSGVKIENVSFPNSRGHSIEIAAAKDVVISGCSFDKYYYNGGGNDEAVNIDAMIQGWIDSEKDELMGPYDEYCCENVEIKNCYFNDLYRAVGSHNSVVGRFHKNVQIHDNTMTNIKNYAVGCPNYVNTRIYNNNIVGCGRGIDGYVETYAIAESVDYESSAENHAANVEITGNNISLGSDIVSGYPYGIRIGGTYFSGSSEIDNGKYYATGYTVTNNSITGFDAGVFVCYAKDATISGNVTSSCRNGYDINGESEISTFNSNKSSSSNASGILVRDSSKVWNTAGNEVENAGSDAVDVQSGSSGVFFIGAKKFIIGIGEVFKPKVYSGDDDALSFASSKKKAVKVTKAGKVKGLKKGSATITGTQDGCSGTLTVSAKKAPAKIKLPKKKTLKKGAKYQINPKVNKGAACTKFKYMSSNKKIAKVSSTGVVTAKKKGTVTITVTSYNGVKQTMTIKVK